MRVFIMTDDQYEAARATLDAVGAIGVTHLIGYPDLVLKDPHWHSLTVGPRRDDPTLTRVRGYRRDHPLPERWAKTGVPGGQARHVFAIDLDEGERHRLAGMLL